MGLVSLMVNGTASGQNNALCGGRVVTVNIAAGEQPTNGDDVIIGTSGDDVINGLAGNDIICGLAGEDTLFGGPGNDQLRGGSQADTIYGGIGNDRILGGPGPDELWGDSGSDRLIGSKGSDRMYGGQGKDTLLGGKGNDLIIGDAGNDRLGGGSGFDEMYGLDGRDRMFGGAGDDYLDGGNDDDRLFGGDQKDTCYGEQEFEGCELAARLRANAWEEFAAYTVHDGSFLRLHNSSVPNTYLLSESPNGLSWSDQWISLPGNNARFLGSRDDTLVAVVIDQSDFPNLRHHVMESTDGVNWQSRLTFDDPYLYPEVHFSPEVTTVLFDEVLYTLTDEDVTTTQVPPAITSVRLGPTPYYFTNQGLTARLDANHEWKPVPVDDVFALWQRSSDKTDLMAAVDGTTIELIIFDSNDDPTLLERIDLSDYLVEIPRSIWSRQYSLANGTEVITIMKSDDPWSRRSMTMIVWDNGEVRVSHITSDFITPSSLVVSDQYLLAAAQTSTGVTMYRLDLNSPTVLP